MSGQTPEEATHLYILAGENQTGPFTPAQVRTMWGQGAITADSLYWREGLSSWEPLSDLMTPKADAQRHNFGRDGKCTKCGCSKEAAGHFGFDCNSTRRETPNIYVSEGEKQTGPHTLNWVVKQYRRKHISDQALYWTPDSQTWQNIRQLGAISKIALSERSTVSSTNKAVHFPIAANTASAKAKKTELFPISLWIAGGCILGCIICFASISSASHDSMVGFAVGAVVLFGLAIIIPSIAMAIDDPANAFHAPRIKPAAITAAASVYTAYQVRQIREELRDMSDFGGG